MMDSQQLLEHVPAILFYVIGAITIASSVLVISMRNPIHSALFLLVTFLCVAVLFVMRGAEFVGAVQILVYAGGIMVLFLFVVMLINVRHLATERMTSSLWAGGIVVGLIVFGLLAAVIRQQGFHPAVNTPDSLRSTMTTTRGSNGEEVRRMEVVGNSEAVGMALYSDYLVPFEVASLFLLVAMVGAIVIGKRELDGAEEESVPDYVHDRVVAEKEIKEAYGA